MSQILSLQELAIVVVAKNHSAIMLNPEFLKCSGCIPNEWELARQPVLTPQASQLVFQNGVSLVAQGNQIIFVEPIGVKAIAEVDVPTIACQYVECLPHAKYQAVGITLRGFVPFNQSADAAQRYLMERVLAPGSWQSFGQQPAKASVNFAYTLEDRQMFLTINEAALRLPEGETTPIVMFTGNFEYAIEDMPQIVNAISNWQQDLNAFQDLMNQHFLSGVGASSDFDATPPELIPMSV